MLYRCLEQPFPFQQVNLLHKMIVFIMFSLLSLETRGDFPKDHVGGATEWNIAVRNFC